MRTHVFYGSGEGMNGDTAEIAVSDDHMIVAQRVTQNASDNDSLLPLVEQVEQRYGGVVGAVLADVCFLSALPVQPHAKTGFPRRLFPQPGKPWAAFLPRFAAEQLLICSTLTVKNLLRDPDRK